MYSKTQKIAIIKSLLYIVDADGIQSNQEISFLRWFSINNNEQLDELIASAKLMSKEDMQDIIHALDEKTFKEVSKMWYICSLSDGIVPEELQVIINLTNRGEQPARKQLLSKEDIHYIIDTYDYDGAPILPSTDFLNRYNEADFNLDSKKLEDQFYNCGELFETIDIYGFNHEEFWYLVLFVKDVVEEKCKTALKMPEKTADEICKIKDAISEIALHPSCRKFSTDIELPDDAYLQFEKSVELTIKENNKKVISSKNDHAIYLIAHACEHLLNEHCFNSMKTSLQQIEIPNTKRLAMFYVVLMQFLRDKEYDPNFKIGRSNKNLFIAQVLHAIGWLDESYATLRTENGDLNNRFYSLIKKYIPSPCEGLRFASAYYQGVRLIKR